MTKLLRTGFAARRLAEAGANFEEVAGGLVAMSFAGEGDSPERARRMGLCDLSPLPRCGFKGRGTAEWLGKAGISQPENPNRAVLHGGMLVASLSWQERLLLNPPGADEDECAKIGGAWSFDAAPGCYPVPRNDTHGWLVVTGEAAAEMLAKVCAVDFRAHKFADGEVAQTSLARISGIVIRGDLGATPAFHVLSDSASADYFLGCLTDAMSEFGGGFIGLKTLRVMPDAAAG